MQNFTRCSGVACIGQADDFTGLLVKLGVLQPHCFKLREFTKRLAFTVYPFAQGALGVYTNDRRVKLFFATALDVGAQALFST